MCKKCGKLEEVKVFSHPTTKRRLGVARVVFQTEKEASACLERYNGTSIMGSIVRVITDPWGKKKRPLFPFLGVLEGYLCFRQKSQRGRRSTNQQESIVIVARPTKDSRRRRDTISGGGGGFFFIQDVSKSVSANTSQRQLVSGHSNTRCQRRRSGRPIIADLHRRRPSVWGHGDVRRTTASAHVSDARLASTSWSNSAATASALGSRRHAVGTSSMADAYAAQLRSTAACDTASTARLGHRPPAWY